MDSGKKGGVRYTHNDGAFAVGAAESGFVGFVSVACEVRVAVKGPRLPCEESVHKHLSMDWGIVQFRKPSIAG